MEKRNRKITINLTEEQYQVLEWLAKNERRALSEICALILVDNSYLLFLERQPKGEMNQPYFIPTQPIPHKK